MKIDITEDQIQKLLEEVKIEFAEMKKSEEEASKKETSEKSEASESSMKKDFPPEEKPEAEAPAEAAPEGEPEAEAPAEDPAAEGGEVSPDQLFDMYSKLSDEDLSMHYMAASKALFAKMDAPAEEVAPEGAAPEAPAPAPAAAPAAPEAPPAVAKSNKVAEEMLEAFKTVESENKELKKKLDELTDTLGKMVSKPARSGFTSGNVIETAPEAPKALTKSQVMSALAKKAQDAALSKEDQEKIVRYSLNPVFTEELSKFLEEKQK